MIIRDFDVTLCTMRKEDPTWRFALAASGVTDGHIVRIATEDGIEGFGYASATPHMGSIQDTLAAELALFRPLVVGRDPRNIEGILIELDRALHGAPQAKAAIDCALHDLVARALGVPLNVLFGGAVRDKIPILRILAIKTPQEMATQAQKLVDKGYRYLKIKVHGEVDEDVARVAAIRRQVGDDVHLTIDANQSYSTKDAIAALNRMAEHRIDLVEQPVSADDFEGLALITRTVPVTVEADEAAGSLREIFELVSKRAVDAISLKIPKLGGLRNTLAAARLCEAGHIKYRLGAAVGSRVLSAQALHLACALPGVDYACELAEFDRLLDDPFEGLEAQDGMLHLPQGPGSGVRLIAAQKMEAAATGRRQIA
ncbi:MAG: L-Ala-D/L-Glu epimerase [Alphaproteobacteria bacterium]|jgi:L-alanine-DL-glutamate epimerase-like enolase superfamily enzyme|nr:L-Ala-D/L-Glu epimerase [Alphaproteobacteria bacterium]